MIIAISGLIGSGKDTAADYLVNLHEFKRESFADNLKDAICNIFGWDREMLEGRSKSSREWREQVDPWWSARLNIPHLTPRWVLQYMGTDVIRGNFHDDMWLASLENKLRKTDDDIVISDDEWTKLATLPQRILAHPDDDTDHNDRTTDHIAYTSACLNIITETTSRNETPQLTEKSFKPILAGQFFIMIGNRGLIQYMRDIGFDTLDDIIDHSYDDIEDDRDRISAAVKELDRLNEVDLFKLHAQCKERFVKNQQWLKSPEFVEQFLPLTFKSY